VALGLSGENQTSNVVFCLKGPGADQLSVIIEVSSATNAKCDVSLFRMTKLKFPAHYGPFFLDNLDWPEKGALMASFSPQQVDEIDKYLASILWYYDSEESLVNMLREIKAQIINVGFPTISFMKERYHQNLDSSQHSFEMQKKSKGLYLDQLDLISRFPSD